MSKSKAPAKTAAAAPADVAAAEATCSSCGAAIHADEFFCEACGFQVAAPPEEAPVAGDASVPAETSICPSCSSTESTDGWCDVCGTRMPVWRDHFREQPSPWVAGVCDRGILHHRNEDAMALIADDAPGSFAALVVCDGVSNATDSDIASLAAARAARDVLMTVPTSIAVSSSPALRVQRLGQLLVDAGEAAQAEACRVGKEAARSVNPPSCTFAAAIVDDGILAAGWVGDSRVYWLADAGSAEQLSVDDSWVTEQVRLGVDRATAEADPRCHAITKWLGIDSTDASVVCSTTSVGASPGWLVVCSDGLWNYVSDAAALRDLITELGAQIGDDPPPEPLAAALVAWANAQGGHDNVTAALARVPAQTATTTSTATTSS